MLHFDAYAEYFSKYFDELAEVHASFCNVVENGFVAIALIFHITDLHVEVKAFGYLSGAYHGRVLAGLGFGIFVHVYRFCFAVNAFDVVLRFDVGLTHLQWDKAACQCYYANVMSGGCFYGNDVAFFQRNFIAVAVITFAGIFELHFYQVAFIVIAGDVGKPVVCVELLVLSSATFGA